MIPCRRYTEVFAAYMLVEMDQLARMSTDRKNTDRSDWNIAHWGCMVVHVAGSKDYGVVLRDLLHSQQCTDRLPVHMADAMSKVHNKKDLNIRTGRYSPAAGDLHRRVLNCDRRQDHRKISVGHMLAVAHGAVIADKRQHNSMLACHAVSTAMRCAGFESPDVEYPNSESCKTFQLAIAF